MYGEKTTTLNNRTDKRNAGLNLTRMKM